MFDPIEFESDRLVVHGFRPKDIQAIEKMAGDVYAIFSDEATLRFIPQKRLGSVEDAAKFLRSNVLSFYAGRNYLHFIRLKASGRVIGMVDIITPEVAAEHYTLDGQYPYFIEFCLKSNGHRQQIMSAVLPDFISAMSGQGIKDIAAVVNRRNSAAKKVVLKTGFAKAADFDILQDLYRMSLRY